jgi:hypothetical protein
LNCSTLTLAQTNAVWWAGGISAWHRLPGYPALGA